MALSVQRSTNPVSDADRAAILASPGFGRYFTDHMVKIDWTADAGWKFWRVAPARDDLKPIKGQQTDAPKASVDPCWPDWRGPGAKICQDPPRRSHAFAR